MLTLKCNKWNFHYMLLLFPGVLRLEASVADKASHFCPFIHRCPICHLYFHMFAAFISLMYVHVLIFSCKVPIPPLSCHSRLISHCLEEVFSCHTPHLFPKSWLCANSFCIGFPPWWLLPSGCYPVSVAFLILLVSVLCWSFSTAHKLWFLALLCLSPSNFCPSSYLLFQGVSSLNTTGLHSQAKMSNALRVMCFSAISLFFDPQRFNKVHWKCYLSLMQIWGNVLLAESQQISRWS